MRTRLASAAAAILLAATALLAPGAPVMAALAPINIQTPFETFPAGTVSVPSAAQNGGWLDITAQVQQGYNTYFVGVDTTDLPVSDQVAMTVFTTGDNGQTIQQGCGITTTGGTHTNRYGVVGIPSCGTNLPALGPNGLKVRAQVTLSQGGQLRLQARLEQD